MQQLVTQGTDIETVAATFMVTSAVVKQRLCLASVSPKLHEVYAEDGMTLEQLMAFSVCDDHERQEQVWDLLQSSYNKQPYMIRAKLTEDSARRRPPDRSRDRRDPPRIAPKSKRAARAEAAALSVAWFYTATLAWFCSAVDNDADVGAKLR